MRQHFAAKMLGPYGPARTRCGHVTHAYTHDHEDVDCRSCLRLMARDEATYTPWHCDRCGAAAPYDWQLLGWSDFTDLCPCCQGRIDDEEERAMHRMADRLMFG
jgi:ribosomal protein L37AE/L43A